MQLQLPKLASLLLPWVAGSAQNGLFYHQWAESVTAAGILRVNSGLPSPLLNSWLCQRVVMGGWLCVISVGDNALVVRAVAGMQEMGRKEMNGPDEPACTTPCARGDAT